MDWQKRYEEQMPIKEFEMRDENGKLIWRFSDGTVSFG